MARQGDLFQGSGSGPLASGNAAMGLQLQRHQLEQWQDRLAAFQGPLFEAAASAVAPAPAQRDLFGGTQGPVGGDLPRLGAADPVAIASHFNPLELSPQNLLFWRWPTPPQRGAALYLVLDQPTHLAVPLLLYVGETARAEQRWKGEHDCKAYLAAYGEAAAQTGLNCRLSIRFWFDVPTATRPRRQLEQALIRHWLPPFNKETRQRWATPFTADPA
jgi:hypothetical protein